MEVRPRCSDFATTKANARGAASALASDHGELLVDESMSIVGQSIARHSKFE